MVDEVDHVAGVLTSAHGSVEGDIKCGIANRILSPVERFLGRCLNMPVDDGCWEPPLNSARSDATTADH